MPSSLFSHRAVLINQFLHCSLLEAQKNSGMAGVGRGNGYINGVASIRHPAAISEVDEFCNALGGKKPIHSILIANNGMAAVKFIRSVRTWAYETFGTEKAILLVAMATPEDMRINAEHIRIADQFVEVPGGTNNNNYANVQLIVEVCLLISTICTFTVFLYFCPNVQLQSRKLTDVSINRCSDLTDISILL